MYFPLIVYDPLNSPLTIYDISHLADKILSSSKCHKLDFRTFFSHKAILRSLFVPVPAFLYFCSSFAIRPKLF